MARRKAAARSRTVSRSRRRALKSAARNPRVRRKLRRAKRKVRRTATKAKRRVKVRKATRKVAAKRQVRRVAVKAVRKRGQPAKPKTGATVRAKTAAVVVRTRQRRTHGPAAPLPAVPFALPAGTRSRRTKAPAIDRQRRLLDEPVLGSPSTLTIESQSSAARSGHAELIERIQRHNETGPELTSGDIDANWEEAYSSGDEAPGGDNPTPDQDVVEEIGRALGVEYDDQEELKSADKIASRDRHRWEFDPASAEDYRDRSKN